MNISQSKRVIFPKVTFSHLIFIMFISRSKYFGMQAQVYFYHTPCKQNFMWNSNCVVFSDYNDNSPVKSGSPTTGHSITEQIITDFAIQNIWEPTRKLNWSKKDITLRNKTEMVPVQFLAWGQTGGHTEWAYILCCFSLQIPSYTRKLF